MSGPGEFEVSVTLLSQLSTLELENSLALWVTEEADKHFLVG